MNALLSIGVNLIKFSGQSLLRRDISDSGKQLKQETDFFLEYQLWDFIFYAVMKIHVRIYYEVIMKRCEGSQRRTRFCFDVREGWQYHCAICRWGVRIISIDIYI